MATIEITWSAFAHFGKPVTSAKFEFELDADEFDLMFCERAFAATNTYQGRVWDALQGVIPAERSHTALSVGDKVSIDGRDYLCAPVGFVAL